MRANQITKEKRVIESKFSELDADAACNTVIAVTDTKCQRFANMILYAEMRLPAIALLPLVGKNKLSIENAIVRIRHAYVQIRRDRFFGCG